MLFWFYSLFGGYAGGRRNGRGHGSGNDALGRRKLQPFIGVWDLPFFSRDARAGAGTGADAVAAIARSGGGNFCYSLISLVIICSWGARAGAGTGEDAVAFHGNCPNKIFFRITFGLPGNRFPGFFKNNPANDS